jgi:hypothetical protein
MASEKGAGKHWKRPEVGIANFFKGLLITNPLIFFLNPLNANPLIETVTSLPLLVFLKNVTAPSFLLLTLSKNWYGYIVTVTCLFKKCNGYIIHVTNKKLKLLHHSRFCTFLCNIGSIAPKICLKYIKSFWNLPLIHARATSFTLRKKCPLLGK